MLEARVEPRRFGRYTLLTKLAAGGMASVYLAHSHGDLGFARLVAVKIIHPHLLDQPEFVARFLHEARLASEIRHPHVVSVLDVGQSDTTPYLVLDYVRGASLAELVQQAFETKDPPSVSVACTIVQEALDGLHAVHSANDENGQPLNLVHRDISPHNLLVSTDGVAYVTDLGIARARGVVLTQGTGLLGKAGYIAPEQLAKEPLTHKVDLFAMGVVLWELLTLQRLFEDLEAEVGMLTGVWKLVPASAYNKSVTPELDRFIAKLLSRNPDARHRSASEAAHELARLVPRAPRVEVAEWVQGLSAPRLDRIDAMLREARALRDSIPDDRGRDLPSGSGTKSLSWPAPVEGTASIPVPAIPGPPGMPNLGTPSLRHRTPTPQGNATPAPGGNLESEAPSSKRAGRLAIFAAVFGIAIGVGFGAFRGSGKTVTAPPGPSAPSATEVSPSSPPSAPPPAAPAASLDLPASARPIVADSPPPVDASVATNALKGPLSGQGKGKVRPGTRIVTPPPPASASAAPAPVAADPPKPDPYQRF